MQYIKDARLPGEILYHHNNQARIWLIDIYNPLKRLVR
jgi:hypothetical protein